MGESTPQTPYQTLNDVTYEAFRAELAALNSPMLPEAATIWEAARPHSRLFLFHGWVEKRYETVYASLPPWANNPLALKARGYPEEVARQGPYAVFPDVPACCAAWFRRWTDPALDYVDHPDWPLIDYTAYYCGVTDVDQDTGAACDPDEYCAVGLARVGELPAYEGGPMPGAQRIVVVAGHRSYDDPGSPAEKERTDDLARAYRDALRAAGHSVWWLQEHDGDADPDDTVGGLDTVGQRTRDLCRQVGATVMLDLHFEGHANPAVRGCFAIVPDVTGLTTRVPGGAPPDDTWANNGWDVGLARALARAISAETTIPLRPLVAPGELGVMSERQTGVGTQGFRLAMFAYTVDRRAEMVRLVIEHGALTNPTDRAIIDAPGFYQKVGRAAVAAVNATYGAPDVPEPEPPIPSHPYPPGITAEDCAAVWGTEIGIPFQPDPTKGTISGIWVEQEIFSRLIYHVRDIVTDRELFWFASGDVIGRLNASEPFRLLY